jgi:hypothetical protein
LAQQDRTAAPLSPNERASAARLMEAVRDALAAQLDPPAKYQLCGYVQTTLDRGAIALRQGNRAAAMDRATSDLDHYLAALVQGGE